MWGAQKLDFFASLGICGLVSPWFTRKLLLTNYLVCRGCAHAHPVHLKFHITVLYGTVLYDSHKGRTNALQYPHFIRVLLYKRYLRGMPRNPVIISILGKKLSMLCSPAGIPHHDSLKLKFANQGKPLPSFYQKPNKAYYTVHTRPRKEVRKRRRRNMVHARGNARMIDRMFF